jgi:uncharacterized iron-regulated membrane protein
MNDSSTLLPSTAIAESPGNRFYRTVWRWHFYARLFVIPFMLILATTGIIYLFKPQLDAAMYHHLLFVQPGIISLPYTEQVPKAVELGVAIHMGKYFGLANQLLMLLAALITILLSVSGAVMWWQRHPQATSWIGAPSLPPYGQSWRVPLAIVAVLGIAFPLVGLSLITVLVLDYALLSRIPGIKRILN